MKLAELQLRIEHVQRFVDARALVRTDPGHMVVLCEALLEEDGIEVSLHPTFFLEHNAILLLLIFRATLAWY